MNLQLAMLFRTRMSEPCHPVAYHRAIRNNGMALAGLRLAQILQYSAPPIIAIAAMPVSPAYSSRHTTRFFVAPPSPQGHRVILKITPSRSSSPVSNQEFLAPPSKNLRISSRFSPSTTHPLWHRNFAFIRKAKLKASP